MAEKRTDSPRPPGGGAATTIRVVDARRVQADLLSLSPVELRSVLEPLAAEGEGPPSQAVLSLEFLAARLRLLLERGPGGGGGGGEMAEVALRQLLYSEEVVPIVLWPPGRLEAVLDEGLRVRPGVRRRAFSEAGTEIAVAAEESVAVVGLVLETPNQGALVFEAFAGGGAVPFSVLAVTGSYSAPVISAALARVDPRAGPLAAPDPPLAPYPWGKRLDRGGFLYSREAVAALRRQLSWALEYHLSGAGGGLGVGAADAAGAPGAAPPPPGAGAGGVLPADGEGGALLEERARFFVGELARVFPWLTADPAEFFFRSSALLDIYRVGGQGAFRGLVTEGREAATARLFLARAAHARATEDQLAALRREDQAAAAEARQYFLIIEDKLGTARAAALEAAPAGGGNDDPEAVLGRLTPKERKLVEVEHANRRAAWEAEVSNKCPHVRLAFRLRQATSAREALRLLAELATYFVPPAPSLRRARDPDPHQPKAEDWLICKLCGFRALCPHVRELALMEGQGLAYEVVRSRLMKYALRYSDRGADGRDTRTTYSYFCRICSERLSEFTQEDRTAEIMGAVGTLDEGLRRLLWGVALAVAELARFPVAAADPRLFASAAAGACHPLLLAAEATVARRGGGRPPPRPRAGEPTPADPFGDEDETPDTRTRLSAIIFVYAFLLNLIRSSAGDRDGGVGFEGVRAGAKMHDYARAILQTIARRHRALLAQLEDITEQFVADRFREAYRLVANGVGAQAVAAPDEAAFLVRNVAELDPIYRYLVVAARVFGDLPPARPATPAGAAREFETALGPGIPALLLGRGGKKKAAPLPELAQMLLGIRPGRGARRTAIEYPPGADLLLLYGAPEINFYAEMYAPPPSVKKKAEAPAFAEMGGFAAAFPACGPTCARETVIGGRAARPPPSARRPPPAGPRRVSTLPPSPAAPSGRGSRPPAPPRSARPSSSSRRTRPTPTPGGSGKPSPRASRRGSSGSGASFCRKSRPLSRTSSTTLSPRRAASGAGAGGNPRWTSPSSTTRRASPTPGRTSPRRAASRGRPASTSTRPRGGSARR